MSKVNKEQNHEAVSINNPVKFKVTRNGVSLRELADRYFLS
ncbi:hypothetical protein ACI2LM_10540 [Paenibacillus lautus]|nr:Uncharacterised protein [Actinobacillus pleuropneumoniae]